MEREADQQRHHGREHDGAGGEAGDEAGMALEQETIPLDDVGPGIAENPAVDDV